jgi:hypothetical protein
MDRRRDKSKTEEELVITPGGARPKRLVKQVGPKEIVRFDEDGKGRIVKKAKKNESL